MLRRILKVLIAISLSVMFTVSLLKLVLLVWKEYPMIIRYGFSVDPSLPTVEQWLEENNFTEYKHLFLDKGKWKFFQIKCVMIWNLESS